MVQFDGIWLNMQTQQDGLHEDNCKCKRGKRILVLVALGLWTDGSGKRRILDWEIADWEEQAAWKRLVQRLWERGVRLETRLQAIVRYGTEGLEQAAVYHATDASEVRARLTAFAEHWRATQPQAVATFEWEFERAIRYSTLEGMVREVVRTTSLVERTNRELRRKFRQVGCFSSPRRTEVAAYIQVTRLNT